MKKIIFKFIEISGEFLRIPFFDLIYSGLLNLIFLLYLIFYTIKTCVTKNKYYLSGTETIKDNKNEIS